MGRFEEALSANEFVVTAELDPPRGADLERLKKLASRLDGFVDAIVLSDNRRAVARLNPLIPAEALGAGGVEVILTLTCRDRNRLALQSDLLAAKAAGVETVLLVTGDFVTLGDQPDAKPVYDLDSVQALQLASRLAEGRDLAEAQLEGPARFFLGAALAAGANPLPPQILKFGKKIEAGADFFISQPLDDLDQLKGFLAQIGKTEARIIAGVEVKAGEDLDAGARLFKEIKGSGLAVGVHLAAPDHDESLVDLLKRCGL